jgi:histidinol-phosphate aminotransferase
MLAASAETMQWLRRVISPYSVNALALACLPAVMDDQPYLDWYVGEVKAARALVCHGLGEMGLKHWPSAANFVLIFIGPKHREFVLAMKARGVLTRDRSADPGCDGCVRLTIGTREQMDAAMSALKEALKEIGMEIGR